MWKWLEDWTGVTLLKASNAEYVVQIKYLNDVLYQTNNTQVALAKDKLALQGRITELEAKQKDDASVFNVRIAELNGSIESLKTALAQSGTEVPSVQPAFIDQNLYCYRPNIQSEGEDISVSDPRNSYVRSDLLNRALDITNLRKLPKYQKLMKIWEYVIRCIEYKYDKSDNWQFHPCTIMRKYGDCEDGTILFVDACRAAGIPADQVFNTVGSTSFGYHSYPVVFLSSEDLAAVPDSKGQGFYIFETTLDTVQTAPKKLNGSQYWAEGGLQNWLYFGGIKASSASLFNGITQPKTGAGHTKQKEKIDNSEKKRQKIIEYWRDTA